MSVYSENIRDCQGKGQDDSFGDVGMRNLDQWELTRLIQSFICIVYYSLTLKWKVGVKSVYWKSGCVKIC